MPVNIERPLTYSTYRLCHDDNEESLTSEPPNVDHYVQYSKPLKYKMIGDLNSTKDLNV